MPGSCRIASSGGEDGGKSGLAEAAALLQQGGVIAFPTETVYGLGALHGRIQALERLRCIKGRGQDKPFQVLIAEEEDIAGLGCRPDEPARALMAAFWPGPLTLVMPGQGGISIGLRLPDHEAVRALIRAAGRPIVATSANRQGEPPAQDARTVAALFGGLVDLILDGGPSPGARPSTVVSVADGLAVLREGAIPASAISAAAAMRARGA